MKLRLPRALFRALMACFSALISSSLAAASSAPSAVVTVELTPPDLAQTDSMLCWAASAADILALETGADASAIYRCITAASGNMPGYVETALSWYKDGARGELRPQRFDGTHTITRHSFESLYALANSLDEALRESRAASIMLYAGAEKQGMGHAVTVYASEYENGRLYFSYVDSADGVEGMRRAEIVEAESGFALRGTEYVVGSLSYLGEDGAADKAPAAPVGAYLHSSPLYQEYSDLAENRGVYRFGYNPSVLTYRNGEPNYSIAVTPDYSVVADMGCYTLVHNGSFQMTVDHNGIMVNASFSARYVGSENAQVYSAAGIRGNDSFVFGQKNPYVGTGDDFKLERITRLVTDVNSAAYCTDTTILNNVGGMTYYRVGAGNSGLFDTQGNISSLAGAWGYGLTAGIATLGDGYFSGKNNMLHVGDEIGDFTQTSSERPLPSATQGGDSGSPVFIYNSNTQQFEVVGLLQGGNETSWGTRYSATATETIIDACEVRITTTVNGDAGNAEAPTIYISGAHMRDGDELISSGDAASYLRKGVIAVGDEKFEYNGIALDEFADGTWKKLDADKLNWYTYRDADYLNAALDKATNEKTFGVDDLFYTSNLKFVASSATAHHRIELTENVDLGVGHVQFSLGEGTSAATYDVGQSSSNLFLSSAGFVVDKGVTVNNYFTYEKGRELRRVGEGTMNMVGTGNNDVLLNIGGAGLTCLDRTGGYAAYSALVNNEAVLRLADSGQVHNNVTLGAGGGVLDFNGNDYRWTSGGARAEGSDGETYFGLTVYEGLDRVETSTLANYKAGSTTTITIERRDDFEFAGAFRDGSTYTGSGSVEMDSRYTMMPSLLIDQYKQFSAAERQDSASTLKVIYNGGGTMDMTGVYTILTGDSGFEVASGTVSLHGTNTIHAIGSESGTNTNRLQNSDDWHYAMAEMNVKVGNGGTFELGDHALLIGDIKVDAGGNFVMKQAVNTRYEHVEGWYEAEDTYALADYYGLKGNVELAEGAAMTVRFDEKAESQLNYGGNISGEGSVTVDAGKGTVVLTGQNTFSGEKTVESGDLHLAAGAEGDTTQNKWMIGEKASLALDGLSSGTDLQRLVDSDSTGVLALTQTFEEQIPLEYFPNLIVGAAEGQTVRYGKDDIALQAIDNTWTLGGGGGTLVVDFLLTDEADGSANKLVLGNEYSAGTVRLTNERNSFTGGIEIVGDVALEYTDARALGSGVTVDYGNVLRSPGNEIIGSGKLNTTSRGVLAIADGAANYDLSAHGNIALGAWGEATLTGTLTVADGASYRFGGSGSLTVDTQLSGNHDIVIDGQGRSGSRVTLARAAETTGSVLVQGYDAAEATEGNVNFSFTADNAVKSASSLTIQNNATVNLNGTNQQFNNLEGDASALIEDTKGGSTLTLNNTSTTTYGGDMQLAATDVQKVGTGTLALSGTNSWKSLTIAGGIIEASNGASLGGDVTVESGAALYVTQGMTINHAVNISGFGADKYGVDGTGAALVVGEECTLNNGTSALNVVADAAIDGNIWFAQLNLKGNSLIVRDGDVSFSNVVGENGHIILEAGAWLTSMSGSGYDVQLNVGAGISLDGFNGGAGTSIELNGGTLYMSNYPNTSRADSTYAGNIHVTAQGGTINNYYFHDGTRQFNLTGRISDEVASSTLIFKAYEDESGNAKANVINVQGELALKGNAALKNAVVVNLQSLSHIAGELNVGENATAVIADEVSLGTLAGSGTVRLSGSAASLRFSSTGTDFGGTLELTNHGHLYLNGLADGGSLGRIETLRLGADGHIHFSSLEAYAGENAGALLHVGSLTAAEGSGLVLDAAALGSLAEGTYRLLTSDSSLEGLSLLNEVANSRRELELLAGDSDGVYTLDIKVKGVSADVTWQGSGTLQVGVENAENITTSIEGDHRFMSQDSLTIISVATDAGEEKESTIELGGVISASSVTYAGAGKDILQSAEGGYIDAETTFRMAGTGTLTLGDEYTIKGRVEMVSGTLVASAEAVNAMSRIDVTGNNADAPATLILNLGPAVTTAINIAGTLQIQPNSQYGVLDSNLHGNGTLVKVGSGQLNLVGSHESFTGDIRVESGALRLGTSKTTEVTLGASSITLADSAYEDSGSNASLVLNSAAMNLEADINWGNRAYLYVEDGADNTLAYTLSGTQTLNGKWLVTSPWGKQVLISGLIQDAEGKQGSIEFTGHGEETPVFTLSGENTYSGGTIINRGNVTVYATNSQSLGTGAVTLMNGALSWKGVGENWDGSLAVSGFVLGGTSGVLNTNSQHVTLSQEISGEGVLNKGGAGTLTLNGSLSYTGKTNVQAGILELGSKLASTANIDVAGGAGLILRGEYLNGNDVKLSGGATVQGSAAALSGAASYNAAAAGGVGIISITEGGSLSSALTGLSNSGLILSSSDTSVVTSVEGVVSGGMALGLQGNFSLNAANSHSGGTELGSGSLLLNNASALGTGALYAHAGTTVTVGADIAATIAGVSSVDALVFEEGSSVNVGAAGTAGKLSFGSLSGPASFVLDIYSADSYDRLEGDLAAGSKLQVNLQSSTPGDYLLVNGSFAGDTAADITFGGAAHNSGAYTYDWSSENGLMLTIGYNEANNNLWTGGESGTWDSTSASWSNGGTYNAALPNAVFRVEQGTTRVSTGEAVSTATLLVETHEGAELVLDSTAHAITADALVKEGEGTLTLADGSSNRFTSIEVNGGTLSVEACEALNHVKSDSEGVSSYGFFRQSITGNGTFELRGGELKTTANAKEGCAFTVTGIRLINSTLLL